MKNTTLENLLDGKVKRLADFLGRNYARKERIRLKAILASANMMRYDLMDRLKDISENGTEKEKIHAAWAIERLLKMRRDD